ncbi:arginine--tRNA ligase [Buchnera aphidicola]|uniref:Arginine--tRNA ligase n=1 Tax=Buchnera aphidicola (Therioaphis trifolii) TaxID=1241884 RepID=A0A4D6YB62_9GAMM|nr:arginine--tRNA ligase [Buchnera aphidicola]QCI27167.1 arginine--tRNA ligase [Buchnera aphidicola (Therioaphis trifolii)]
MNIELILKKDIKICALKSKIPKKFISFIQITSKSKIGNYQINGIIKISKLLKINTEELSKKFIYYLQDNNIYKKIKYSAPGFINIFFNEIWLSEEIEKIIYSNSLGIPKEKPKNIIIDYSSPNMAKEMHVGHLRSTILGDVMARTLSFLKHNVIRINHIGDWGFQFGLLIAYLKKKYINQINKKLSLKDLEKYYQKSKKLYENDNTFKIKVTKCILKLQNKNQKYIKLWKKIVKITIKQNKKIYNQLNITLKNKHNIGESFYIKYLSNIILDLKKKKIATKKNGNTIIYLKNIKNKNGQPMGVIIQKKDTSFLYSTIDLACLKYRINKLNANRIIYYTDVRQKQHLKQIEIIAKKAKYIPKNFNLEHHIFGMVLTKNNKPFKTRDGKLIKLSSLINESIKKSKKIIKHKNPNFNKKKISQLSKIIGISAIKYADLSKNREKNYIFNWNNMLSFHGNTALYIQYTYTRIQSIIRKSKFSPLKINKKIILTNNIEIKLSIKILQFEETIQNIKNNGMPHILCLYLFQISSLFSIFYEKYPIIYAKRINIQKSRLKLSFLIARIIKLGLKLLGIKTVNYM